MQHALDWALSRRRILELSHGCNNASVGRVVAFPRSCPRLPLDRLIDNACRSLTFAEVSLQGGHLWLKSRSSSI